VGVQVSRAQAQDAIPFSSGTEAPKTSVLPNACDSHIQIFSTRFPASPDWKGEPVVASDVAARKLQKRLGTSRVIVVTPSTYGIDNRATLDGVAQFGNSARAVVVVDLDISEAELRRMATQGAVGIRVNFGTPQSWGLTTAERLETMARKVRLLGWHVQVYATGDQIVGLADVLSRLPTPLVIDHLARLPPSQGVNHPAYAVLRKLLDGGRTWMKPSGATSTRRGVPRLTLMRPSSRRRLPGPHPSGWSGAATGLTAARGTCQTMQSCSTSSRYGLQTRPLERRSSSTILLNSTASPEVR
jgi:D-galactarolactone isomerase